jgi:WD40 repeat protein
VLHAVAPGGRDVALAHGPDAGEPVLSVAFSHDGSRVLLATGGVVRSWDTATGALATSIATNTRTLAARFSPDDRLVFTGGMDNRLRAWDADTGAEYTGFGSGSPITSIALSPDGGLVAATTGNAVMLWTLSPLAEPASRLRAVAACRTGVVVEGGALAQIAPACMR